MDGCAAGRGTCRRFGHPSIRNTRRAGPADRPTGLTADLDDGGVLLSWDAPDETVDSWQVLRRIRPAETAHTVVATVDGELNEWTDTDLTAGDRRYKVVAVRDSLTSRRSRVAKLVLDEPPPPLRPTPGTITYVPEKEPLTERATGDACTPAANSVTVTLDATTNLTSIQNWVQVTLRANAQTQIYVEKTEAGTARIDFVCGPDQTEIADTTAAPGTGLGSSDASLDFTTSAAGLHYVKITATSGGKTVRVADLINDGAIPTVAVGASATGTFGHPTFRTNSPIRSPGGGGMQILLDSISSFNPSQGSDVSTRGLCRSFHLRQSKRESAKPWKLASSGSGPSQPHSQSFLSDRLICTCPTLNSRS